MIPASSAGFVNCGQWPVGRSTYVTSWMRANSWTGAAPPSIHERRSSLRYSGHTAVTGTP